MAAWHAGGQEFESPWLHWDLTHCLKVVSPFLESDFSAESGLASLRLDSTFFSCQDLQDLFVPQLRSDHVQRCRRSFSRSSDDLSTSMVSRIRSVCREF